MDSGLKPWRRCLTMTSMTMEGEGSDDIARAHRRRRQRQCYKGCCKGVRLYKITINWYARWMGQEGAMRTA